MSMYFDGDNPHALGGGSAEWFLLGRAAVETRVLPESWLLWKDLLLGPRGWDPVSV